MNKAGVLILFASRVCLPPSVLRKEQSSHFLRFSAETNKLAHKVSMSYQQGA
jgi:hypothetical protein